jgi:hypothetical protein
MAQHVWVNRGQPAFLAGALRLAQHPHFGAVDWLGRARGTLQPVYRQVCGGEVDLGPR